MLTIKKRNGNNKTERYTNINSTFKNNDESINKKYFD